MRKMTFMFKRVLQLMLVGCLTAGILYAADDPFVGEWKLNPSRSKLRDEMVVTKVGENKYAFDLGGGQLENIVVDGTDQRGLGGTTLAVGPEGTNWKVIRKKDGRMIISATWTLSKDGNSLTDNFTGFNQDGSTSNVKLVYRRTQGSGPGFAGTWVNTSENAASVFTIQIKADENGGLSLTTPSGTRAIKFDGKSARRVNASTLEMTREADGKIMQRQEFNVSPDLKTLTITTHTSGRGEPQVSVFERQ